MRRGGGIKWGGKGLRLDSDVQKRWREAEGVIQQREVIFDINPENLLLFWSPGPSAPQLNWLEEKKMMVKQPPPFVLLRWCTVSCSPVPKHDRVVPQREN